MTDTDKSLYKHFGLLHSLGAYIDEITTMDDKRFRAFAYNVPEGREPGRLERDATGFRECHTWRMPIFSSSNKDAYDLLNARITSEAEKYRVLQFPLDRAEFFTDNRGYYINRAITQNYGHAGPLLAAEIIRRGGPAALMHDAMERFEAEYGVAFEGPERFYKPAYVCAHVIGGIMEDLGLIRFSAKEKVAFGLPVVHRIRAEVVNQRMDGIDTISQFLTENANSIVMVRMRPEASGNLRQDIAPPTHRSAVARSEVERDVQGGFVAGVTYINASIFKSWCRANGAEYRSVVHELRTLGVSVRESVRKSLYKGVDGAMGQTTCLEIDVATHPRLIESHELVRPTNLASRPRIARVLPAGQ